jgi:hypothetical protein
MSEGWDEQFAQATQAPDVELLGIDENDSLDEVNEELPSEALVGLMNIGRLTKDISIYGDDLRLRTLKIGEELEVGLLISKWTGTPEEGRAYAVATVAATIETLNGKKLVQTLGPSNDDELRRKFDFVRTRWYWPVIQQIYEEYIGLQREQVKALEELRSKSQASLIT